MKSPGKHTAGVEGAIMIFALVIILTATFVLAGWVQMLATANIYPDAAAEGMKSRIALENARALSRQYLLVALPTGSNANSSANLPDDWGGFDINASVNFWTNTNFILANPFSPFGNRCFTVTNLATLSGGNRSVLWRFFIKSRSPLIAGYPLVVQNPATTNLAWVPTGGNKIYWDDVTGFSEAPVVPFTSGTNSSGFGYIGFFSSPMTTNYSSTAATVTYPTNTFSTNTAVLVPPAVTNGSNITRYFNGGSVAASIDPGQTNAILRYAVPGTITNTFTFTHTVTNEYMATNTNISTNKQVYTNGTNHYTKPPKTYRTAKYMANHPDLTYYPEYVLATNYTYSTNTITVTNYATNNYTDNYTNSSPTNVTLVASAQTNTLHVIVPASNTNTTSITLSGTNSTRRVFINHAGGSLTLQTATANENYTWWLGMTVSDASSTFTVLAPTNTRSLTLQGGIRANRTININQGNLTLNSAPESVGTNAAAIEFVTDRLLWIEDGRNR
ncbi:MAG: hypothetical protein WC003_12440 [Terrimicrobiaceae bacterium]